MSLYDPTFVKDQYRDSANLNARVALHARFSTATRDFPEWIFDHLDLPANARVLEAGCGTGLLWSKNRERVPASWRITLFDFSFGMVETTRATGIAAHCLQSDVQQIPVRDAAFDAVIANHMLYHVPDLPRALAELARVLKPGGKAFAATNGVNHMRELAELTDSFGIKPASATLSFGLENGEPILARYFSAVRRIDFANALVVTEVEPLVAYICSMFSAGRLRDSQAAARVRERVAARITRDGAMRITKSAGLFIAEK